ncbi:F-box/WD repeat-containing protein 4 isoform X1 [Octopus bimaculoides]|uniref:F-box domain-containing protein n=1 Tax=Octopus bimaculoides TaxID=37653 RepID=A0A0L8G4T3_OCTBM|nr:F-box/WD repeat-containing protein 4 isoform X1 [Octopus bimaculoides]|eukprot:XP_014784206.1 PREDICTED: F-box/WD repeat-containing protein 4-like isoform X1 [Octopus bimaculoides]
MFKNFVIPPQSENGVLESPMATIESQSSYEGSTQTRCLNAEKQLMELPEDILYLLFRYLDLCSLGRLCRVCRKLRRLIYTDCVWLRFTRQQMVIKDLGHRPKGKSCTPNLKEQYRVTRNWIKGRNRETAVVKYRSKQLPWMHFDDDYNKTMWLSIGSYIKCYKVLTNGLFHENCQRMLGPLPSDVTRFVLKDSVIVTGCREGSVVAWDSNTQEKLFHCANVHKEDSQCVDFHGDIIVSGSRDATLKILNMQEKDTKRQVRATLHSEDRLWSVAMNPDGTSFTSGNACCNSKFPLQVWDLYKGILDCSLGSNHRHGAGVLDIKYETPFTLLSCGYDSFARLWDLRTNKCELMWEEPFNSAVYCVKTHGNYTMLTGTARHGMTRLWDKRVTKSIQFYYAGQRSSPVYSMAFNSKHLYLALDKGVSLLDFTVYK